MAESISLKLTGAPIAHPGLPSALRSALRGVDGARADEFIPDGYLKISAAFEVGRRGIDARCPRYDHRRRRYLGRRQLDSQNILVPADQDRPAGLHERRQSNRKPDAASAC